MFVWAGNAGKLLVNERGIVKDKNQVRIQPKYDTDGYKYVEIGNTRYYVHELVIQNHGKPPHQNRLPKDEEVVIFKDGDPSNCHIDNLAYAEKSDDGTFRRPEGVPEAVEEYVWQLLKEGKTYNNIQEMVARSNYEQRTISTSKIAEIRRERSKKAKEGKEELTPSEQQSLNAIKRELGETDDKEAKKQALAKKKAEEKSERIQKEKKERGDQYDKEHVGGGYYKVEKNGTDVTSTFEKEIRFRKNKANEIVRALKEDEEEGMKLVEEEYESRRST